MKKEEEELVIKLSPNESVTDSVCKALFVQKEGCGTKGLHQTLKPSLKQDELGAKNGKMVFIDGEWRNQIGVMLG